MSETSQNSQNQALEERLSNMHEQMEKDGLSLSRSTINDWHADVCEALRPLYELQIKRTMSSRYLAADGSPMPVVNNEKHRTVKHPSARLKVIN